MIFSEHNREDVEDPTLDYIKDRLRKLSPKGPGYFALTSADGSYVQTAGARLKLVIEHRQSSGPGFEHYILGRVNMADRSAR